jgi:ribosomal protein L11 methyltransferase
VRAWPALDLRFADPSWLPVSPVRDRALAILDDFSPSALDDERPPTWRVFFRTAADRNRAADALTQALGAAVSVTAAEIADEGWAERSQAQLRAIVVGAITVAPPWDVPAGGMAVVIQPSMGFGTGHHASTRLCLRLLQQLDVRGARVADAGTGSGVLAIAALRLGAAEVLAFDDDPDAIANARENAALNGDLPGLDLRIATLAEAADLTAGLADVVMANLSGAILRRDAGHLARLLGPGGRLIASGFTRDEEDAVRAAFPAASVATREDEDEWVGILLKLGIW